MLKTRACIVTKVFFDKFDDNDDKLKQLGGHYKFRANWLDENFRK